MPAKPAFQKPPATHHHHSKTMCNFAITVLASTVTCAAATVEYVALVAEETTWVQVEYPDNFTATSAGEVSVTTVTTDPDELGAWAPTLSLDGAPTLTGRVRGDKFYASLNTGVAPSGQSVPGGCCADTVRVFDRTTGESSDIDINGILMGLLGDYATDSFAYTNHMIDLSTIDGRDVILLDVVYKEPSLNDALADAIVAIDAETGDVIETADGNDYFEWLTEAGTMSETASEQIYKIQHRVLSDSEKTSSSEDVQQFHQNGLTRVTTAVGITVLAATHKTDGEVVIVKCPFSYTREEGGGSILQRFGSPSIYVNDKTSEKHAFGLAAADNSLTALHNVYYTLYPDGRETMTHFVNEQEGARMSQIFEFDMKLTPEPSATYDDTGELPIRLAALVPRALADSTRPPSPR